MAAKESTFAEAKRRGITQRQVRLERQERLAKKLGYRRTREA